MSARESPGDVTREQAKWLLENVSRVQAFKVGIGSDGYPPAHDALALLKNGGYVWVTPAGEERSS